MMVKRLIGLGLVGLAACAPLPGTQIGYGTSSPSQTIELYDASGKHIGYGKAQGGTVELYTPSGTRLGYGKR